LNPIRQRAKEQFPSVLLTLLSIVQALALGMLWTHIENGAHLFEVTPAAAFYWAQVSISFFTMLLVWILYVNTVMRFSWVPGIVESVLPFFIGLLEFILVATMGPGSIGLWFLCLSALCAVSTYSSHLTFVRARSEQENQSFFENVSPATLRDYVPQLTFVVTFGVAGAMLLLSDTPNLFAAVVLTGAYVFISVQFGISAKWWKTSLGEA